MDRRYFNLVNDTVRDNCKRAIDEAPDGYRVTIQERRRSLDQNAKMWPLLTEVSQQVIHHGIKLSPNDWKILFVNQLGRELRMVPNLDGDGFVNLGTSSSDLSVAEMRDLIELIYAYGATHGVTFNEPKDAAA